MTESPKSGLPRSAASRLRHAAGETSAHPDANLLAAFSEQALASAERELVLTHLAQCADCREIVALSLPPVEISQASYVPRGWFGMRPEVMRWAVVGASAAVVVAAVLLVRPELQSPASKFDKLAVASRAAKAEQTPAAIAQDSSKLEAEAQTKPKEQSADANRDRREVSGKMAKQIVAAAPPPPPPAPNKVVIASGVAGGVGSGEGRGLGPASRTDGSAVGGLRAIEPTAAAQPTITVANQAVEAVEAKETDRLRAADADEKKKADALVGYALIPPRAKDEAGKPAAAAMADSTADVELQKSARKAQAFAMTAARSEAAERQFRMAMANAPRTWRIVEGKLQWSLDAGKSWHEVKAPSDVRFLSVDARQSSVWAGGTSGVVLRSPDNGATWIPVDKGWSGDVVYLRFQDEKRGVLRTSTKEEWSTEDGGVSWKRR